VVGGPPFLKDLTSLVDRSAFLGAPGTETSLILAIPCRLGLREGFPPAAITAALTPAAAFLMGLPCVFFVRDDRGVTGPGDGRRAELLRGLRAELCFFFFFFFVYLVL
jgi:hypothetical protein